MIRICALSFIYQKIFTRRNSQRLRPSRKRSKLCTCDFLQLKVETPIDRFAAIYQLHITESYFYKVVALFFPIWIRRQFPVNSAQNSLKFREKFPTFYPNSSPPSDLDQDGALEPPCSFRRRPFSAPREHGTINLHLQRDRTVDPPCGRDPPPTAVRSGRDSIRAIGVPSLRRGVPLPGPVEQVRVILPRPDRARVLGLPDPVRAGLGGEPARLRSFLSQRLLGAVAGVLEHHVSHV